MAQAPGEVSGAFGYKDPTGANIKLEYTADDRGFIPHGVHHPAHPENQFGLRLNETPSVDIRAATPHTQRMAVESNATSNEAVTVESNATSDEAVTVASNATSNNAVSPANVPAEPALIQSSAGDDGSYSFSYKTASSSRSESADAQNSVTGKYSIVGDDGINHGISYTAGSETGYIAEGDSLPRGPVVPGAESGIPTGRILPVLSEDEANGLATDIVAPQTSIVSSGVDVSGSGASGEASVTAKLAVPSEETHTAGATEAAGENHVADTVPIKEPHTFSVKDDTVPIQDSYRSSVPGDGSYSFSYHTSSSSRSESSDAHNSLTGHYSFISEDGVNRNFNYTAGSETGYIVDGDSLPIGPSVPGAESGKPTGQILPVLSEEEANALALDTSHIASQTPLASSSVTNQTPSVSHPENQFGLRIKETPSVDIRAETPHTQHMAVESYATSNEAVTVASSATSNDAVSPANVPAEPAIIQSSAGDDGSYSFSYKTASSSRSESADAQNSVTGKYSIVGDDGINHGISYTAGSETGYIAEGDSLPRGPVVPGAESGIPTGRILPVLSEDEANGLATDIVAPQTSIVSSGVDVSGSGAPGEASVTAKLAVPSEETHTAGATEAAGENHVADDTVPIKEPHTISVKDDTVPIQDSYRSSVPGDGSYSFSYHTSSSSRSESSDAHNSLTGHYSFISEDGVNRNFNYTAGSETGYIVDGDSLPIGPSVPGAESGKPTGQILLSFLKKKPMPLLRTLLTLPHKHH
ncbi:streptococcal hemagglutinin-like isoform X2 [Macrobrachium rosenbergii]